MQLIYLLFIISQIAFAEVVPQCSRSGTVIFYINGINVDSFAHEKFRLESTTFISSLIERRVDIKNDLHFEFLYNSKEEEAKDIAEAVFLWANSKKIGLNSLNSGWFYKLFAAHFTSKTKIIDTICKSEDPKVQEICNGIDHIINKEILSQTFIDLTEFTKKLDPHLKQGRKIIFLTHSAGAMYADALKKYIQIYYPGHMGLVGHVALARPLKEGLSKTNSITINSSKDKLLDRLRNYYLHVPVNNFFTKSECDLSVDSKYGWHDYSCYLSSRVGTSSDINGTIVSKSIKEFVQDSVYLLASKLVNNDSDCCNMSQDGKPWRNKALCDSDPANCLSGYVSNKVLVTNPDQLEIVNSQLCGPAFIDTSLNKIRINNSLFQNTVLGPTITATTKDILVSNVKISGAPIIKGPISLLNVEIEGNGSYISNISSPHDRSYLGNTDTPTLNLSGNNNISGSFVVRSPLKDVTIQAASSPGILGAAVYIDHGISIGTNSTLEGLVRLHENSIVGDGVKLTGIYGGSTCFNCVGIMAYGSEFSGQGTEVKGYLESRNSRLLSGSKFDISMPIWGLAKITNSTFSNTMLNGTIQAEDANISDLNLNGRAVCIGSDCSAIP